VQAGLFHEEHIAEGLEQLLIFRVFFKLLLGIGAQGDDFNLHFAGGIPTAFTSLAAMPRPL